MTQPAAPALGPETSADGRRNAYFVDCRAIGGRSPYAACLDKIERHKREGELQAIYKDCCTALDGKVCPATAMREQEIEQHKAIYFLERPRFKGLGALVDKAKQFFKPSTVEQLAQEEKPAPVVTGIGHDYMAAALNAAVRDEAAKKQPAQPDTTASVQVKTGESMLEAARRLLAERNAAKR
jgi:hypothetical protein